MKLVENHTHEPDQTIVAPDPNVAGRVSVTFLIKQDGSWHFKGSPVTRKEMVALFASMLTRDEKGRYFLESPVERVPIKVEDAAFIVVGMSRRKVGQQQELRFFTNMDESILAGPAHRLRMGTGPQASEPVPYLHVRDGKGDFPLEARFNRAVYYEFVALAEPGHVDGRNMLGVWSCGVFFPIGDLPVEDPHLA